jgi:hypothetical protein
VTSHTHAHTHTAMPMGMCWGRRCEPETRDGHVDGVGLSGARTDRRGSRAERRQGECAAVTAAQGFRSSGQLPHLSSKRSEVDANVRAARCEFPQPWSFPAFTAGHG